MESKKDIRKRILAKRAKMSFEEWEEKSAKIYQFVISHPFFQSAEAIYCYVDYRNEVSTKEILQKAWSQQKKVAVPKVDGEFMEFRYIHSFSDLEEGYRGVLEPVSSEVANDENTLVLMPGSVFDTQGHRIGYGKGYYDKYLYAHPNYKTMAIGFEFQVLEVIPSSTHDIKPNVLITEETIYEFKDSK